MYNAGMRRAWVLAVCLHAVAGSGSGERVSLREEKLHGRAALVLDNGRMRLSALPGGGYIGEVRLLSPDPKRNVNPMRVPHYPTIDPHTYNPARDDAAYGGGENRFIMSGYMGHYLCFPYFGGPSKDEAQHGLGTHGEAVSVEWKAEKSETAGDTVSLLLAAELPKTRYRVRRAVSLRSGETVAHIEEWVENLLPFDRPMHWVHHATFGPPFAEPGKSFVDAPIARVADRGDQRQTEPKNERAFRAEPHSGSYRAWLLDKSRSLGWCTMYHTDYRVLIGYLFSTSDSPWIGDWQENRRNRQVPWDGKAIARGLEIGTTPFGGLRQSVEEGKLFDVPTYRWIAAGQRLKQSYAIFLAEIPDGYRGVGDVRSEGGNIVIEERETGKTLSVAGAPVW